MAVDLDNITPQEFKDYFFRDFPYLPVWLVTVTYNTGDLVFYLITKLFYNAINDGVTTVPTDTNNWVLNTTEERLNYILDEDIEKAFDQAKFNLNQSIFGSDGNVVIGFFYLTAHYLCQDIQMASRGIKSIGNFMVSSKSVGNVSENYSIPQSYLDDPFLSYFTRTTFGLKYLSLVQGSIVGNVQVVQGGTLP